MKINLELNFLDYIENFDFPTPPPKANKSKNNCYHVPSHLQSQIFILSEQFAVCFEDHGSFNISKYVHAFYCYTNSKHHTLLSLTTRHSFLSPFPPSRKTRSLYSFPLTTRLYLISFTTSTISLILSLADFQMRKAIFNLKAKSIWLSCFTALPFLVSLLFVSSTKCRCHRPFFSKRK